MGDEGLERNAAKGEVVSSSEFEPLVGGAKSGALGPELTASKDSWDDYLTVVVEAWPHLPADVRSGILAMVELAIRDTRRSVDDREEQSFVNTLATTEDEKGQAPA